MPALTDAGAGRVVTMAVVVEQAAGARGDGDEVGAWPSSRSVQAPGGGAVRDRLARGSSGPAVPFRQAAEWQPHCVVVLGPTKRPGRSTGVPVDLPGRSGSGPYGEGLGRSGRSRATARRPWWRGSRRRGGSRTPTGSADRPVVEVVGLTGDGGHRLGGVVPGAVGGDHPGVELTGGDGARSAASAGSARCPPRQSSPPLGAVMVRAVPLMAKGWSLRSLASHSPAPVVAR